MKKYILILIVGLSLVQPAWAQSRKMAPVYEDDSNRQTLFNKTTDFLSTLGQSSDDKEEIIQERRKMRRDARLSAERRKHRAETQKRIKTEQQTILEKEK